jgi:hypothetical protein
MSSIGIETFIKHITTSINIRKQFSADVILDFYCFCQSNKDEHKISYHTSCQHDNIDHLLKDLPNFNNYSKEFEKTLLDELKFLKKKRVEEKIMLDAERAFVCEYNMYYPRNTPYGIFNPEPLMPINNTLRTIMTRYDHLLINLRHHSPSFNSKLSTIWNLLTDEEKIIWIKPKKLGNPYTKWISLYSHMVKEVYPNTSNSELYKLMGPIWTNINSLLDYGELLEYNTNYYASYIKYTDDEKNVAREKNEFIMIRVMNTHRKALEITKKFIHMKRFLKLCKSEKFNKYFWNPKNMGGKWHINKMTKEFSKL